MQSDVVFYALLNSTIVVPKILLLLVRSEFFACSMLHKYKVLIYSIYELLMGFNFVVHYIYFIQ